MYDFPAEEGEGRGTTSLRDDRAGEGHAEGAPRRGAQAPPRKGKGPGTRSQRTGPRAGTHRDPVERVRAEVEERPSDALEEELDRRQGPLRIGFAAPHQVINRARATSLLCPGIYESLPLVPMEILFLYESDCFRAKQVTRESDRTAEAPKSALKQEELTTKADALKKDVKQYLIKRKLFVPTTQFEFARPMTALKKLLMLDNIMTKVEAKVQKAQLISSEIFIQTNYQTRRPRFGLRGSNHSRVQL